MVVSVGYCLVCGNSFTRHHVAAQKYCSDTCRWKAGHERQKHARELGRTLPLDPITHLEACTPPAAPARVAQAPLKRLEGDAVLSDWRPTGDGKDMPDIPDFLRRTK